MNFPDPMRGELAAMAASLLVLLSGELLKWQFPATSAGDPNLPKGMPKRTCSSRSGAANEWIIGVSMIPGQTAFTLTPQGATSREVPAEPE